MNLQPMARLDVHRADAATQSAVRQRPARDRGEGGIAAMLSTSQQQLL
jgi:hypothetical protein